MTQPTTETAPFADLPPRASDILMNLIVTLLAPMFLALTSGNVAYARMAAAETVNAYRARNQVDLIAVAQIIAFGLAALGSLSLSMADNLSVTMTLRLRGNATALNRAAEQNRRAYKESLHDDASEAALDDLPAERFDNAASLQSAQQAATAALARLGGEAQPPAPPATSVPPAIPAPPAIPTPEASKDAEKRHQAMWAIAMVKESSEITASIPGLPPAERKAASIRAAALSSTANQLLTGTSSGLPDTA